MLFKIAYFLARRMLALAVLVFRGDRAKNACEVPEVCSLLSWDDADSLGKA
ncbi:MAG TPA: hypothetical protein VIJ82_17835 [Streptosporangiaceae bacterium]